jgi:hypothetical protein
MEVLEVPAPMLGNGMLLERYRIKNRQDVQDLLNAEV